jgi:hypothetical protein
LEVFLDIKRTPDEPGTSGNAVIDTTYSGTCDRTMIRGSVISSIA